MTKTRLRVSFEKEYDSERDCHILRVELSGAKNRSFQYGAYRIGSNGVQRLDWDGRIDFTFNSNSIEDIIEKEKKSVLKQYKDLGHDVYQGRRKRK